jgi:hypothetical protein
MLKASPSIIRRSSLPVAEGRTLLPHMFARFTRLPLHLWERPASTPRPAPRVQNLKGSPRPPGALPLFSNH